MTTWFLIIFSLHVLAVQHSNGVIQVVKFPTQQACESARGVGTSDDGVMSVCTTARQDVNGFIAAMNCQDSKVQKLEGDLEVARFSCTPQFVTSK